MGHHARVAGRVLQVGAPTTGMAGHIRKQKEAVTCPTCGQIPKFFDISTSGEQGLDFDAISEILNETHMASHEVYVEESEEDEHNVDDVTFTVQSHVFRHAEEWPQTRVQQPDAPAPNPGDDAITLRWFRDEWNQRDSLDEDELLLDPRTREPLTRRNPPDVHGRMPR